MGKSAKFFGADYHTELAKRRDKVAGVLIREKGASEENLHRPGVAGKTGF